MNSKDTTITLTKDILLQNISDHTVITDDTPIDVYQNASDSNVAASISYTKVVHNNSSKDIGLDPRGNIYIYSAEFIYILVLVIAMIEVFKVHKDSVLQMFKSLFSQYMTNRMISTSSYRINNLIIKSYIIIIFLLIFVIWQIFMKNSFELMLDKMSFLWWSSLSVVLMIVMNIILREFFVRFSSRERMAFSKVTLLDKLMIIVYNAGLLSIGILYLLISHDYIFIANILALMGFGLIISIHLITLSKLFYTEKLSFLQYILYLCATKLIYIAFISILIYKMLH